MCPLQFLIQTRPVEAAVGLLGNLRVSLTRSQFSDHSGTTRSTHRMLSPSVHLKVFPNMRIVNVEHMYPRLVRSIEQLCRPRNHGHGTIAFDLPVYEVVEHIHNQEGVPAVIVVNVG